MDTSQTNLVRLRRIAAERGLALTADTARIAKVAGLMAANHDAVGEWICPCPTLDAEIAATGSCHCRLFVST